MPAPSAYQRGKKAGEAAVQCELWGVEHDWKLDRQRLIAERDQNEMEYQSVRSRLDAAFEERDAWRRRAEGALAKLQDRVEVAA